MAYTKKATAYILDCSPSMGITLPNHDRIAYQEAKDMIISKLEDRVSCLLLQKSSLSLMDVYNRFSPEGKLIKQALSWQAQKVNAF